MRDRGDDRHFVNCADVALREIGSIVRRERAPIAAAMAISNPTGEQPQAIRGDGDGGGSAGSGSQRRPTIDFISRLSLPYRLSSVSYDP
jgi:hypothetical protein